MGIIKKGACFALKIEGGSLFAHRADGTTYAAHSLELKVKASLKFILKFKRCRAKRDFTLLGNFSAKRHFNFRA